MNRRLKNILKTYSKHTQNILKTSFRYLTHYVLLAESFLDTQRMSSDIAMCPRILSPQLLQMQFNTFHAYTQNIPNTSSKHTQNIFEINIFLKIYSKHTQNILKTYSNHTLVIPPHSKYTQNILKIYSKHTQSILKRFFPYHP